MDDKIMSGSIRLTSNNQTETKPVKQDSESSVSMIEMEDMANSFDCKTEKNNVYNMKVCYYFYRCRRRAKKSCLLHSRKIKTVVCILLMCLYASYFSYAMYLRQGDSSIIGFILITIVLTLVILFKSSLYKRSRKRFQQLLKRHPRTVKICTRSVGVVCVLITCVTLVTEVIMVRPSNLVSLTGIIGILVVFLLTSTHPHKVQWRPVISGLILQYLFALIVLKVPAVYGAVKWLGAVITDILSFSSAGEEFIYGPDFHHVGLVFRLVPLVVFVMCVMTVLEHLKVLHAVLKVLGRFLAVCLGVSPAEALNASANIFFGPDMLDCSNGNPVFLNTVITGDESCVCGYDPETKMQTSQWKYSLSPNSNKARQVDSLMIIRPFLDDVTPSELHCLMANGLATVTGSTMGLYIMLGISADHLLAASVMSAPAALSLSKLAVPETRRNAMLNGEDFQFVSRYKSVMDAFSSGATTAMTLSAAIIANCISVVSVMKMINYALSWLGELVNVPGLTMQWICSFVFYPLALALGVDVQDGHRVAELIGVKAFINEIVAYATLGHYRRNRVRFEEYVTLNYTDWSVDSVSNDVRLPGWNVTLEGGFLTVKSDVITTYALCGFANFISVGIIMGCYLVLIPHRKAVIFKYILRSMMVGHCASFITSCIAGLLHK